MYVIHVLIKNHSSLTIMTWTVLVFYTVYNFTARTVNKTGIVGRNVTLICNSSSDEPVNWWYKDLWGSDEREVVVNGEVVNGNVYRMTLIGHDLVIHNALLNDSGVYTCVEETGFGEHHKIALTISGIVYFYTYRRFSGTYR